MKLSDIADVRIGLVASRKEDKYAKSDIKYKLFTLSAIRQDGTLDNSRLTVMHALGVIDDNYIASVGDVLVRLTAPYTACLIDEKSEGAIIPHQFAVVRTLDSNVNNRYLAMMLNSSTVKNGFKRLESGATVKAISVDTIKNTEINLQSQCRQEMIARYSSCADECMDLRAQLIKLEQLKRDYIIAKLTEDKLR